MASTPGLSALDVVLRTSDSARWSPAPAAVKEAHIYKLGRLAIEGWARVAICPAGLASRVRRASGRRPASRPGFWRLVAPESTARRPRREEQDWEEAGGEALDPSVFIEEILPLIQPLLTRLLSRTTGLSRSYCSNVRAGPVDVPGGQIANGPAGHKTSAWGTCDNLRGARPSA